MSWHRVVLPPPEGPTTARVSPAGMCRSTSALDTVTEHRIQSAFDELSKGRTTLIIAHRLSTVRSAHRIAVIDGSQVSELGTWDELVAQGGEFAKLCESQALA